MSEAASRVAIRHLWPPAVGSAFCWGFSTLFQVDGTELALLLGEVLVTDGLVSFCLLLGSSSLVAVALRIVLAPGEGPAMKLLENSRFEAINSQLTVETGDAHIIGRWGGGKGMFLLCCHPAPRGLACSSVASWAERPAPGLLPWARIGNEEGLAQAPSAGLPAMPGILYACPSCRELESESQRGCLGRRAVAFVRQPPGALRIALGPQHHVSPQDRELLLQDGRRRQAPLQAVLPGGPAPRPGSPVATPDHGDQPKQVPTACF